MFLSVIVGYVLSAMFAFAGVLQIVSYVESVDRTLGYRHFIDGLAQSCGYLGVSVGLVLLIQIATFLERLVMESKKQPLVDLPSQPVPARSAASGSSAGEETAARGAASDVPAASGASAASSSSFSVSANPTDDPEAPRVPDLPGTHAPAAGEPSETEEERRLNYFKM